MLWNAPYLPSRWQIEVPSSSSESDEEDTQEDEQEQAEPEQAEPEQAEPDQGEDEVEAERDELEAEQESEAAVSPFQLLANRGYTFLLQEQSSKAMRGARRSARQDKVNPYIRLHHRYLPAVSGKRKGCRGQARWQVGMQMAF